MCSIYGVYSNSEKGFDRTKFEILKNQAADRGRDDGCMAEFDNCAIGSWRATPTPEVQKRQYREKEYIVHNGTIANDLELGNKPGMVDSDVLYSVLSLENLDGFCQSLKQLKGSYSIAAYNENKKSIYLACNYKPLYYYSPDNGETIFFSSMERHFNGVVNAGSRPIKLPLYSAIEFPSFRVKQLYDHPEREKTLVICSAGLDSTTAAYLCKENGENVTLLHFLYGCKAESQESRLIKELSRQMNCAHVFIPIDYKAMHGSSPLLSDSAIADGIAGAEYAHEWVPARNLVMLSLALAYAEANGFTSIVLGNNLEEAGAYPDNEEEFTYLFQSVADQAVQNGVHVKIRSPLGNLMKHEIVAKGVSIRVPYELTYSCYKGNDRHCGNCGPCFMRKTAFERIGLTDPVFNLES